MCQVRTYDLIAITFDGKRKGVRLAITPTANNVIYANITLEAVTRVFGRVQFDDGRPATNALVGRRCRARAFGCERQFRIGRRSHRQPPDQRGH
jgi:hypothetical protein